MRSSVPYRQIEHTADLALEIEAEDEEALLREAARALVELLTEGAELDGAEERLVQLEALDAEDRLVRWLNEVLVLAAMDGFLAAEAEVQLDGDTGLRASIRGRVAPELLRGELKSVTYHDLLLRHGPRGCRARVVIDV
jgi:SHS2 domain-containing protein